MTERFFFGIPLISRAAAGDWAQVEHLLGLTLRSVLAQQEADVRVLLAAHDLPAPWLPLAGDPRFTLLRADWPPAPPTVANDDGGRKKWLIKQRVREEGGGLLMFLDADDWVPCDLVRRARAAIGPDHHGAVLCDGFALDHRSGRIMPFPMAGTFDGPFHRLCGSSTIGRVVADAPDALRRDPHAALGSHHEWMEAASREGATLAALDLPGMYLIGTGENHSEREGPFAAWRREITAAVRNRGRPLDEALARRFGQEPPSPEGRRFDSGGNLPRHVASRSQHEWEIER
jgi:hypothetical protein